MTRARRIEDALDALGWEPFFWPPSNQPRLEDASRNRPVRRTLRKVAERYVLIDRFDPASAIAARSLTDQEPDAGYLIVPTFSPAFHTARALRRRGAPYVVDTGDPWHLTSESFDSRTIAGWRSRRAERELLGGAAGFVVTTRAQAEEIRSRFPGKPLLVRPNGIQVFDLQPARSRRRDGTLRLVHFGRFEPDVRIDILPFLHSLADSGRWERIEFTQFGPDLGKLPDPGRPSVVIRPEDLIPWPEAVRASTGFDAAVVIGNRPERWMQLPSKAIEYLGLPIPRIALCPRGESALRDFAVGSPGYLMIEQVDGTTPEKVSQHLDRDWDLDDLAAPVSESWDVVAAEVAGFVDRCLRQALETTATERIESSVTAS